MKHVLILGAARSGKTTLAQMLHKQLGYNIVSVDSFITAFEQNYPQLGFKHHGNNRDIAPFAASYVKSFIYNYPQTKFAVEGYHIRPEDAVKLFDNQQFEIVVLGYPQLSPQEAFDNVKKYEGKEDYTVWMSDEDVLSMVTRHVEHSKEFKSECQRLGLNFTDTSYNRRQVLDNLIKKLSE